MAREGRGGTNQKYYFGSSPEGHKNGAAREVVQNLALAAYQALLRSDAPSVPQCRSK